MPDPKLGEWHAALAERAKGTDKNYGKHVLPKKMFGMVAPVAQAIVTRIYSLTKERNESLTDLGRC